MADQLQLRGGTTSEHSTFTGALREVTVDTDKDVLVVHDNSTAGGHPLMAEDGSNSALALGSAGTPSLKFTGDTNTGIYSPGADTVGVSTGGAERIRIDSSGNVGLGTSSPAGFIHIQGTSTGTETYGRFTTGPANGDQSLAIKSGSSRDHMAIQVSTNSGTADDLALQPDGGNVGIGTTSPSVKCHVQDDSLTSTTPGTNIVARFQTNGTGYDASILLGDAVSTASRIGQINGNLTFHPGSATERARIDSSGALLVGATTNNYSNVKFLVAGANSSNYISVLNTTASDASESRYSFLHFRGKQSGGEESSLISIAGMHDGSADDQKGLLSFRTNAGSDNNAPTERMRITSNGATTVVSSTSAGFRVNSSSSASLSSYVYEGYHSASSVSTGTRSFIVYTNGNVYNTNNVYAAISDIKLKENIVDASSQWNDLKAIQVRNYNFKEETGHETHTQLGVIAQEIELVSPSLVSESPDRDEEGNDLGTVTKSVNYSVLYMKAVKALQEAMERIETLEAKVAALEAN